MVLDSHLKQKSRENSEYNSVNCKCLQTNEERGGRRQSTEHEERLREIGLHELEWKQFQGWLQWRETKEGSVSVGGVKGTACAVQ